MRRYFGLERENRLLLERIAQLEERLSGYVEAETAARLDSYMQELGEPKFRFITASVVANTVNRPRNLITINRGRRNGVVPDMAVLSPDGAWWVMWSIVPIAMRWFFLCFTPRSVSKW